jgi:dienelactone hydrolase
LPRALVRDLTAVNLLEVDRRPAARTLVIDGGNFAAKDALASRLAELGSTVASRSHPGHKFLVTVSHRAVVPDDVIAGIIEWLCEAHPKATAPTPPPAPSATGAGPCGERPVVFGQDHPLFGILTPGDASKAKPERPIILLSNAGCVNRTGPHRSYVKMARRWASLGFDVFRLDLSGIGDSPAAPGTQENVPYPPSAMDDLKDAASAPEVAGRLDGELAGSANASTSSVTGDAAAHRRPIIIAGLCSGGDYAFQLGASAARADAAKRGPKVAGALLLNPRTFCVLDLAAVESADGGAPPSKPVEEVPRSLAAMAQAGVETLLVVSRNDPGVAYVDQHASDAMRAVGTTPAVTGAKGTTGFRRVDVDGSDHTFTPVSVQAWVSDLLTEHLVARHG